MRGKKPTIEEALSRGVVEILPDKKGLASLMRKKKIRLYLGVDPTGADLHIGHAILLRKLRQFQDLGHEVILLFGTFTARIGDPTGKNEARKPLGDKDIKKNIATYKKQAGKVLDLARVKIVHNGDWLGKLKLVDVLEIASRVTVARLLERDMFQARIKEGREVWAHELLYPLLQGYDSVVMDVDLEIGGTDQTFNMLMGRRLQESYNHKEKYVLTTPLLLGPDGRKMSKSLGNTINLLDSPEDMYGKLMSVRDSLILHYFELCTTASSRELEGIKKKLKEGVNPRDVKMRLAREVVEIYHGAERAQAAAAEFKNIFQKKRLPADIPGKKIPHKSVPLADLLVTLGLALSRTEARRLIAQGGIKVDGVRQSDEQLSLSVRAGTVVQAGKRRFVKIL